MLSLVLQVFSAQQPQQIRKELDFAQRACEYCASLVIKVYGRNGGDRAASARKARHYLYRHPRAFTLLVRAPYRLRDVFLGAMPQQFSRRCA